METAEQVITKEMKETIRQAQIDRLELAGIELPPGLLEAYLAQPDILPNDITDVPVGYKKCSKCERIMKFYLFNKNNSNQLCCTSNCKECQKATAKKSYKKNKQKRKQARYYEENKDQRREAARLHYQENKDVINEKHKQYLQTEKGKKTMAKAHAKRSEAKKANAGLPYSRDLIVKRDTEFVNIENPICHVCGEPILDCSGQAAHIDHIIPIVMGGADCFTNVALVHRNCNLIRSKDARELDYAVVELYKDRTEQFVDAEIEAGNYDAD